MAKTDLSDFIPGRIRRQHSADDVLKYLGVKGIKVLVGSYRNNKTLLRCECAKCSFVWNTNFNNIQQGHLCPHCARLNRSLKRRLSEDYVHRFLIERRIDLLSKYKNSKTLLKLRCELCSHEWKMRFNCIQQGQGCPKCGVRRRSDSHRLSKIYVQQFFKQQGITLLGAYIGAEKPTACQCDKCGYKWLARYSNIQQGQGCPKCKNHAPLTQRDYEKLAALHEGLVVVMAKTGEGLSTWKCNQGHVFQQSYENVKHRKIFCTICSGRRRMTLEDYKILADEHHGKIKLVAENTQINSIWVCRRGHEFLRSYTDIKTDGNFCPDCSRALAERQCKAALEQIFQVPFKKVKLKQLRGVGGGSLELDLYNESLKLALEHHGLQHYKPVRFGHQTSIQAEEQFLRQQFHDQLRREYCQNNGIVLIEIRELGKFTPIDQIKEIIGSVCFEQGIRLPNNFATIKLDLKPVGLKTSEEEMLEKIHRKAEEKGFRLLSSNYLGSQTPHEFMCKNNHIFTKRPYSLFIGQGCMECYKQNRRQRG